LGVPQLGQVTIQVAAGGKGPPGAGDDHHARFRVVLDGVPDFRVFQQHAVVRRVELLRAVDRYDQDTIGPMLEQQELIVFVFQDHASTPWRVISSVNCATDFPSASTSSSAWDWLMIKGGAISDHSP